MKSSASLRLSFFLLMAGALFVSGDFAASTNHFAGNWALKIGNRVLMALVLKPAPGAAGGFAGWLASPEHFQLSVAGEFFSEIRGPAIRYPIVQSRVSGNCLMLTTQNPANKSDKDHIRFCLGAPGHATLGLDISGVKPLPLIRETRPVVVASDWDRNRTYFLGESDVSNAEMLRIFEADQKDRQGPFGKIDWAVVNKRDTARRKLVRQLLAQAKLHSGKDFERAAFVFQHGDKPDDYLLAHTLAMVAVARGYGGAIWISAATLDRYLHSIHQPQIYGTQFEINPQGQFTQEPYNRHLISDTLRHDLGVPPQAEQKVQEKQYDKGSGK